MRIYAPEILEKLISMVQDTTRLALPMKSLRVLVEPENYLPAIIERGAGYCGNFKRNYGWIHAF